MTNLRTQMIERIDEVIPTCILHGSWAPQMAERIADAVLSVLSAAPSPDGEEVERVATEEAERILEAAFSGDTFRTASGQLVLNPADWDTISLSEIVGISVRAAIAAMRPKQHHAIGKWLSAALEDPSTCEAMKADIRAWFAAGEPSPVRPTLSEEDRARVEEVRGRANTFSGRFWEVGPQTRVAMIDRIVQDRAFLLSLIDKLAD